MIVLVYGINNESYDVFGVWFIERCYILGIFEFMEFENDGSLIFEFWVNYVDELIEN